MYSSTLCVGADVHLFTYVQPSGASLGRPRLEASRLWPSSPGLRTKPACPEHSRRVTSNARLGRSLS